MEKEELKKLIAEIVTETIDSQKQSTLIKPHNFKECPNCEESFCVDCGENEEKDEED